jgi:hypothetical protein
MNDAPFASLLSRLWAMLSGAAQAEGADNEATSIRLPALSFALALLTGTLAVGASLWCLDARRADLARAQQLRDAAFAKLSQVEQEKAEIRTYRPLFAALRAQGWIGEENRLAWTEAISQAQERLGLPSVSYEIEPRQPLRLEAPTPTGGYQLRASKMTLHLDLLHEMDLFNFLAQLKTRGMFAMQDCTIRRNSSTPQGPGPAPRLNADCTLNWLTLGAPGVGAPGVGAPGAGAPGAGPASAIAKDTK